MSQGLSNTGEVKELDYYCSALFKQSKGIDYIRYFLLLSTISCLSYSLFAHGYHLYIATILALLCQVFSWYLKMRVRSIRYSANEFHKIGMLYRSYGRIPSEFQLSHLKALVNKKISSEITSKKETDNNESKYHLKSLQNPKEILMSMIHENCYWNHHLYRSVFQFIITGIALIVLGLVVATLFVFPLIKIDPDYTVPRLAFTFLSFSLIYEILEKATISYNSSKIMLAIDNELEGLKNDIEEEHLLKIFNQYCGIKDTAPDIPDFLYKYNRSRLNKGWKSRIRINTS